jgi:hypothetical protein
VTKQAILAVVREICLALPEASERPSHGEPTFFVGGKRSFATVWDNHHGDGHLALLCAAPAGMQAALVEADPDRYFVPPYVGHRGWIGVRLDGEPDWDDVADLCEEAYRCVAPRALVAVLDGRDRERPSQ